MKNITTKINETRNSRLPKLQKLNNTPNWLMAYPDFCNKMEEIWDDDRKLFATIMYFITKNEKVNEYGWSSMKIELKDLYHQ